MYEQLFTIQPVKTISLQQRKLVKEVRLRHSIILQELKAMFTLTKNPVLFHSSCFIAVPVRIILRQPPLLVNEVLWRRDTDLLESKATFFQRVQWVAKTRLT